MPDKRNTIVMGSSKGGLISLYALLQYPDIFGSAGCLSTHWPISLKENIPAFATPFIGYLRTRLPNPGAYRFYFDYGTTTLDAWYEPYQLMADSVMKEAGFTRGKDWITEKFEGAAHNEKAWRARLRIPLTFLLH
jgi:pimeloyl-ACP methyl ester carboxylesterase